MTFKFRTNINCLGCIQAVTPHLEGVPGVKSWEIDIIDPSKILTVETDSLTAEDIINMIDESGFTAKALS